VLALAIAVLLTVVPLRSNISGASGLNATSERVCTISSLRVTVQNGDGLHHGVELMTFLNVGGTSCKLSGYPTVEAILDSGKGPSNVSGMYAPAPAGARKKASDVQWSWAGGVDVNDTPLKSFVAPTISLAAHTGVATSTLNWIDGPNGNGTCPAFSDLIIGIGAGSVTRFVRLYEPLCYFFAVTPIVAGKTGSMFVRADYSRKANELAGARAYASGLPSSAMKLHNEMEHPRNFTLSDKMQAAEGLIPSSQSPIVNTPWPKLNSSLAIVRRDAEAFGNHAVLSLIQPGYSKKMKTDYLRLLASIKTLDMVLKGLP